MTISETLLAEVEKARSQDQSIRSIALAAGIHEPSLNRFVNGVRSLSLESADRLAEHFGLELVKRRKGK